MTYSAVLKHLPGKHDQRTHAPKTSFAQGKIVSSKPIDTEYGGMHEPQLLTFQDGSKAVWKPYVGNDSISEVFAKELSDKLGFGSLVPDTQFFMNKPGTVQKFIKGQVGAELNLTTTEREAVLTSKDGLNIGVLDYITGQRDRHDGNWMFSGKVIEEPINPNIPNLTRKQLNGKLIAIDNGASFTTDGTSSQFWKANKGKAVSAETIKNLKAIDKAYIDTNFSNYTRFNPMEEQTIRQRTGLAPGQAYANKLWERMQKIIKTGVLPSD